MSCVVEKLVERRGGQAAELRRRQRAGLRGGEGLDLGRGQRADLVPRSALPTWVAVSVPTWVVVRLPTARRASARRPAPVDSLVEVQGVEVGGGQRVELRRRQALRLGRATARANCVVERLFERGGGQAAELRRRQRVGLGGGEGLDLGRGQRADLRRGQRRDLGRQPACRPGSWSGWSIAVVVRPATCAVGELGQVERVEVGGRQRVELRRASGPAPGSCVSAVTCVVERLLSAVVVRPPSWVAVSALACVVVKAWTRSRSARRSAPWSARRPGSRSARRPGSSVRLVDRGRGQAGDLRGRQLGEVSASRLVVRQPVELRRVRPCTWVVASAVTWVVDRLLSAVVVRLPSCAAVSALAWVVVKAWISVEVSAPICAVVSAATWVAVSVPTCVVVRLVDRRRGQAGDLRGRELVEVERVEVGGRQRVELRGRQALGLRRASAPRAGWSRGCRAPWWSGRRAASR